MEASIPMRRQDRKISDPTAIEKILAGNQVCRIAFFDQDFPYIVPMNYGYQWQEDQLFLYFHGAKEGRKLDLLRKNPNVAFEIDGQHRLLTGKEPCSYSYAYESLLGTGTASVIEDLSEKEKLLARMMQQLTGQSFQNFPEKALLAVCLFQIQVREISGKAHTGQPKAPACPCGCSPSPFGSAKTH